MTLKPRQSRDPKRRLAAANRLDQVGREVLAAHLKYTGSAHHKKSPGNYRFHPPVNPRPWKSLCDGKRIIPKEEAEALLRQGVLNGLFSDFCDDSVPKYVWGIDTDGDVYEAKIDSNGYHGYRLEDEDELRNLILRECSIRCNAR